MKLAALVALTTIVFAGSAMAADITTPVEQALGSSEVQGGAESDLAIIRGSVMGNLVGNGILSGSGFSVTQDGFGRYTVTFNQAFADSPTVALAIHSFFPTQPAQLIGIDDPAGGITNSGFHVVIADPRTESAGSQNWEFIAIGRAKNVADLPNPLK